MQVGITYLTELGYRPHGVVQYINRNVRNVPSDIRAQRRFKSACASVQSDQSLRCPHEETLHPWLSKMRPVKILIRLRECAG